MAALIQFPDGTLARYASGRWTCPMPALAKLLRLTTEALPVRHRPQPTADTAAEVAEAVGAVFVTADPEPDDAPADAEF